MNRIEKQTLLSWSIKTPTMRAPVSTARAILRDAGYRGIRLIEYSADTGYRTPNAEYATLMWFGSHTDEKTNRYSASWALDIHPAR